MDDRTHEGWLTYIEEVAPLLKLSHWDIRLCREHTPSDNAVASNAMPYGRRQANIHLSSEFFASSPEEQRNTIVHELIHCHFDDMDERLRLEVLESESEQLALMNKYYLRDREIAVDTLAAIISPMVPLP